MTPDKAANFGHSSGGLHVCATLGHDQGLVFVQRKQRLLGGCGLIPCVDKKGPTDCARAGPVFVISLFDPNGIQYGHRRESRNFGELRIHPPDVAEPTARPPSSCAELKAKVTSRFDFARQSGWP